jgi:hypothetical protein
MEVTIRKFDKSGEVHGLSMKCIKLCISSIFLSISSLVFPFVKIDESAIYHAVSARGWVVSREVPISMVIRAGLVQVINPLINDLNLSVYIRGT